MKSFLIITLLILGANANAQLPRSPDSAYLLSLNQGIDDLVVKQNVEEVEKLFADDFVFSHGSGRIEGKAGWMKTVGRTKYQVRSHDSVTVEQHGDMAILKGQMYIERLDKKGLAKYRLKYIRVFVHRRSQWVLLSHNTTHEVHL